MGEKYLGEKSVGEKSFGENRGRWDAGFRFPLLRWCLLHMPPVCHVWVLCGYLTWDAMNLWKLQVQRFRETCRRFDALAGNDCHQGEDFTCA